MDITELKRTKIKNFRRHPWEKARAGFAAFLVRRYAKHPNAILDIGAGDAYVLSRFSELVKASRLYAVDTAYDNELIESIKKANQRVSIVYAKNVSELDVEHPIDVCLLMDVIEHCEDDLQLLKNTAAEKRMAADAIYLVTVPAFNVIHSGHDKLLGHYRRYSRRALEGVCERSGLKVIASGYFFSSLLPARVMQKFAEKIKLRRPQTALDGWKGGSFLSHLFYAILWADSRICFYLSRIGIHLPGLSAYAICKRPPS